MEHQEVARLPTSYKKLVKTRLKCPIRNLVSKSHINTMSMLFMHVYQVQD